MLNILFSILFYILLYKIDLLNIDYNAYNGTQSHNCARFFPYFPFYFLWVFSDVWVAYQIV